MEYISEQRAEEMYMELLDECNPVVEIDGMQYFPSNILKETDPIAFSCGLTDFIDSIRDGYEVEGY